jgi:pimeloyl-ACP methyl ester carboxylesterase
VFRAVRDMEQGIIEVTPDIQIFYRDVGEGEHVIIIPLASWADVFDRLATGRRVVSYDPRGRGRSTAIAPEAASFDADLADLEAVHRNATDGKATFIGWSYYGGLVARYAMLHPDRVRSVITISGLPIRRSPWMDVIEKQAAERMSRIDPALAARAHNGRGSDQFDASWEVFQKTRMGRRPSHELSRSLRACPNELPQSVLALAARAIQSMGDWDWRDDARRLKTPMLIIEGAADLAPDAAQEWAAYAKNAVLEILDGIGYAPQFEDPGRFFSIIEEFLERESRAGAETARV